MRRDCSTVILLAVSAAIVALSPPSRTLRCSPAKGSRNSRQFGASEVTPDKQIVWNYDGPAGIEIHTTWPVD